MYTYRNDHNSVETTSVSVAVANQHPVLPDKSVYSTVNNYRQRVVQMTGNLAYGISNGDSQQPMLQDNPAYSIVKGQCLNWSRQECTTRKPFTVFANL